MDFMYWIVARLNDISGFFYDLYLDCYYVGWPLDVLGIWFYYLSDYFSSLAWDFYDFSSWVNDVAAKVTEILNWSTIWSYILSYVPNLTEISDWFYYWWDYVTQVVDNWWTSTSTTVLAWIDEAVSGVLTLVDQVNAWLASLQTTVNDIAGRLPSIDGVLAWWSNWTGNVLLIINTWWSSTMGEVQGLIDSAFIVRESFWAGWQDWRDQVTEFFTDPEDWLYKSLDRIIERFW